METKIELIKGVVERWTNIKPQTNKVSASMGLKLVNNDHWYNFFHSSADRCKEIIQEAPAGSVVEFNAEKRKNGMWYFSKEEENTLKVSRKQETKEQPKPAPEKKPDWDAKDRRTVRQNAGRHAAIFLQVLQAEGRLKGHADSVLKKEFFDFAEAFEEWVYRKE